MAMSSQPPTEQQQAVEALLHAARRHTSSVPIRNAFVQRGTQRQPAPGPLARLVRNHGERALDLYLLLRANASSAPWDVARDAQVWARLLGLTTPRDNGANTVSKLWRNLDEVHHLVSRDRRGRLSRISALREDGSRMPYAYPEGGQRDLYFKLPYEYWTASQSWYTTLSLPGKALLLIGMSLKPGFVLPSDRAPAWYGLSSDTVERGLAELRRKNLLTCKVLTKPAPLSPAGKTQEYRYTLLPPFARPAARTRRGNLAVVEAAS